MSRIGRRPIGIPAGVTVDVKGAEVHAKGPKGSISWEAHPSIAISVEGSEVQVTPKSQERIARSMHGTARQLIQNMVQGVNEGFSRTLEIVGVGYNAKLQGKSVVLQIGFCHPVDMPIPEGLNVECPTNTKIVITGVDKQSVGQYAANIRRVRPPEPYKGKGIRYEGEQVRRKAAKASGS
jgi:large subunit ribosomal protein L6